MSSFVTIYREYIRTALKTHDGNFNLKTVARIERPLAFLFQDWWKVDLQGLQRLPEKGPALIVGNAGGILPWAALMLMYAMMSDKQHPRKLHIMANIDWIEDERIYNFAREIGFVPYSADNAKKLFSEGQFVIVFPEGQAGALKPFGERYRCRNFDWTQLMPAVEMNVPMFPLATTGPDESFPLGMNIEPLAKLLSLPAFPVTPLFPFLPFPANIFSLPFVKWKMRVLKPLEYPKANSREEIENTAKTQALLLEGETQAELNRILRARIKPFF